MKLSLFLTIAIALCLFPNAHTQFWKRINPLSERDLFEIEARANMPSGICYKEVNAQSSDPELRIRTHSYCCDGYRQNSAALGMQCDPICTEDCSNGICTGPDVCECYPGYMRLGGRCVKLNFW